MLLLALMIRCMPPSPPWPSWTVGAHCWTWQRHGKPPRLPLPPSPPPAPPGLLTPLIGGINGGPGAPRPTSTTALLPQPGVTGCPVAALIAYLTLRQAMPAPASHPLFINPDGSFVTREHATCTLRARASHCGLYPAQVSSRGLRIGSAWTMANEGVPSPPSKSWGGGSVISCHSCTAACPWIGSPLRQGHCGSPQQTCTWNCTPPLYSAPLFVLEKGR